MHVLVIGNGGQLGFELMRARWPAGVTVAGADVPEIDVTDRASVDRLLAEKPAELVVNAAAYTAVDRAEQEIALAQKVNQDGPANLAAACADRGLALVHISTDYVFDGKKIGAYLEDDPIGPLGAYGRTKQAGEAEVRSRLPRHFILRTSWLYGAHGANFVKTMLRLAKEKDELRVVSDQVGCPTAAADLAEAITVLAAATARGGAIAFGTYHYAGLGRTSWFDFATAIIDGQATKTGRRPLLVPITARDYAAPAPRPTNSELDSRRIAATFGVKLYPWQDSLARVMEELLP